MTRLLAVRRAVCCWVVRERCAAWHAQSTDIESPKHKAWDMLQTAAFSPKTVERTNGVRALWIAARRTLRPRLGGECLG